jgi:hypothetical protein
VGITQHGNGTTRLFNKLIEMDHQIIQLPHPYCYGASTIPDEHEDIQNEVKYGIAGDPDEYIVEVNEEINPHTPYEKVILIVVDLEESCKFYSEVLGFDIIRQRSNLNNRPRSPSLSAYLGNKEDTNCTMVELIYRFAKEKLEHGIGFEKVTLMNSNFQ